MAYSICKKWSDPQYRSRVVPTLFLLGGYVSMGFMTAQRGAAFLDIQLITNTNLESASFFFTAAAVGGVVGALLFGNLYDRFNRNLLIFLLLLGMSATVSVIPYCTVYEVMLLAWFGNAFFIGGFDACASAEVVRIWGLNSQPYLFMVNFGFSMGALLAPLITQPFLVPKHVLNDVYNFTSVSCNLTVVNASTYTVTTMGSSREPYHPQLGNSSIFNEALCSNSTAKPEVDIRLHHAYTISAVLSLLTSLPLLYLTCRSRASKPTPRKSPDYTDVKELPLRHYIIAILLIVMTFLGICGLEDAFSNFMMTFVVKQLNWSKAKGTQVSAVFYGTYTVVRAMGIFCSDFFNPTLLLLGCLVTLLLSAVGIALSSLYYWYMGVWIFFGVCGFFLAVLFPMAIAWINNTVISVNGRVTSFMLLGSATGKLCNPIFIGYLMTELSPLWFCYIVIIEVGFTLTIIGVATIYSRIVLSKLRRHETEMAVRVEEKNSEDSAQTTFIVKEIPVLNDKTL